ncbi:ACT1-like protein [Caenorhabditis elegans]|nr:ACT1-like protein [Caenorhabditis elegans]CTQ87027.1 ACT1-like protein [Caenorhabditis elegans]|eukprot:NP_001300316.1 ACT1-like protein [Caenorhabditis elegans]
MKMDVTIELDLDGDDWEEVDVLSDKCVEDILEDVHIDDPILVSDVRITLPANIRIKNFKKEIRDLILANLDVPTTVSAGSWQIVSSFLRGIEYSEIGGRERNSKLSWKPFEDMHAQILVNALAYAQRVDILVKLKSYIDSNSYLKNVPEPMFAFADTDSMASTTTFSEYAEPVHSMNARKKILLLHYETTSKEKEDFKWFKCNLKNVLEKERKEGKDLEVFDVKVWEKDDRGNVFQELEKHYDLFPHIVVCFNKSYIEATKPNSKSKMPQFRKSISDKLNVEFHMNGNRNLRGRCVLMSEVEKVTDTYWAAVTNQYPFPGSFEPFVKRLLRDGKVKKQSHNNANDHHEDSMNYSITQ